MQWRVVSCAHETSFARCNVRCVHRTTVLTRTISLGKGWFLECRVHDQFVAKTRCRPDRWLAAVTVRRAHCTMHRRLDIHVHECSVGTRRNISIIAQTFYHARVTTFSPHPHAASFHWLELGRNPRRESGLPHMKAGPIDDDCASDASSASALFLNIDSDPGETIDVQGVSFSTEAGKR